MWHIGVVVSLVCYPALAWSQNRPRLVSPDVQSDRRVVFRLWAPEANGVQLSGDWMGRQPPLPMAKGADGVWTVTSEPMEPNIYTYGFLVDGICASDPSCRCNLTAAGRFSSSRFVIPAASPRAWEHQNKPAGALHHERFFSKLQGRMRPFVVYTPPGYSPSSSRQYPALILLPGVPGDENDWTSGGGYAEIVFDNLISDGRMVPMIVVMHASDVRESGDRDDANLAEFEKVLVDELVPAIKERYRASPEPMSWAIAGLSLGGEFALNAGLKHPELFRAIASLSGSLVPRSFERRFGRAFTEPDAVSREYRLIWLGSGSDDVFFGGAKAFAEHLQTVRVPHVFRQFAGGHSMPVFRQELVEVLPLLFQR